ncbi:hypothetical protein Tco_0008322 [Tanacetum coccineum]
MPTPPSLPLSLWSSPLPQIPSPPLPPILSPLPVSPPLTQISSPPLPVSSLVLVLSPSPPASLIHLLGYRAAMRLGIALGPRYEVGESSSAAARLTGGLRGDYGFVATIDREIMRDLERDIEMGRRMTEFTTRVRQDTNEIYTRLDDEQSEQQLMAGRLNMLYRDRRTHARTARLMEAEAKMSREAWGRSMDASSRPQKAGCDYRDAGGRSQEVEAVHKGTEAAEEASD